MKKNMLMMFGLLAAAFAGVNAHAINVVGDASTIQTGLELSDKGKSLGGGLYLNTALKVGDKWVVTPEVQTLFTFVKEGSSSVGMSLKFARILASGPVLKQWAENRTFKLEYRYLVPLDAASQLAGTFGSITVRPVIAWAYTEKLSLTTKLGVSIPLNRNQYQVNRPGTPSAKYKGQVGNALASFAPEFVLAYGFNDKWSVYTNWAFAFVSLGEAKFSEAGLNSTNTMQHQHGVGYSVNDKLSLDFSISEGDITVGKGFKILQPAALAYSVETSYKF